MARRPARRSSESTGLSLPTGRGINPLVLTIFVLVAAFATLVAWLQLSYQPLPTRGETVLAEVAPPEPEKPAEAPKPAEITAMAKPAATVEVAAPTVESAPPEQPTSGPSTAEAEQPSPSEPSDGQPTGDATPPPSEVASSETATAEDPAETSPADNEAETSLPAETPAVPSEAEDPDEGEATAAAVATAPAPTPVPAPVPEEPAESKRPAEASAGPAMAAVPKPPVAVAAAPPVPETQPDAGATTDTAPSDAQLAATKPETASAPAPADGTPAKVKSTESYARNFASKPGQPRVAIVLWSLGLSRAATTAAIQQLPGEVTLGLTPYGRDLQSWADQARAAGHEVLLLLPMEPHSYPDDDPGPHTLLTSLSIEDNLERLAWLLGRFEGYVGVANYMGSRFTSSARDMRPILETVKAEGLIFLDSRAASNSVGFRVAGEIGLDRAINSRFLDAEASRPAIDARLAELERVARTQGTAVGIGFPYPVTLERLTRWIATLEQKGIQLAPLTAVLERGQTG